MNLRMPLVVLSAALLSLTVPTSGQTVATSRMMREKLTQAERMLEALTTSNYALLNDSADRMREIVRSARWQELRSPELDRYTSAFLDVNAQLLEAADMRDLDTAAAAYQSMVGACYRCHKYRKAARVVSTAR